MEIESIIKKTLKGGKIRFVTSEELYRLKQDPWFIYIGNSFLPGVWDQNNFAEGEVGIKADTFERILLRNETQKKKYKLHPKT